MESMDIDNINSSNYKNFINSHLNYNGYGYIGYKFLKSLFCINKYQAINLNLFHSLFPNLHTISIYNLSSIHSYFLNDIINFLQTLNRNKFILFFLAISTKYGISNIVQQCKKYKLTFKYLRYHIIYKYHKSTKMETITITPINIKLNHSQNCIH